MDSTSTTDAPPTVSSVDGIFNPEDENVMEEILKLLDSSDIEFSDDDELAEIQNREPNQPGGESNSDNDEDIDHSVPAPSASGDQSTTPASNNRGRTFWMKKPFPKSLTRLEPLKGPMFW
ncbi:hypothetical protein MRX96_049414 [Rhipicephalus microplus]